MEIIYSLVDIKAAAKQFIQFLDHYSVVAFHGNLGAGKTTFIQAVCEELGVQENVSSPTFSIINQYQTKKNKIIFHIDLYRLKDENEAIDAGVEECILSGNLSFIEWPEKIFSILPPDTFHIYFELAGDWSRKLVCKLP